MTEITEDDLKEYGNPDWVSEALRNVRKLKEESLLTDRQAEVYALKSAGLYNDQIAEILGLSEETVAAYGSDARSRFDAAERTVELRDEIKPSPRPYPVEES